MWMWLLACSSANQDGVAESTNDTGMSYDSSEDTFTDDLDSGIADAEAISISWWKLSGEIIVGIEPSIVLFRDLYTADMSFVCRQRLNLVESTLMVSPLGDEGLWMQSTIQGVDSEECTYDRGVEDIAVGVGELIPDLAVALEVIDWHSEAEALVFDSELAQGAYMQSNDGLWAFGVVVAHPSDSFLIRPIYALRW